MGDRGAPEENGGVSWGRALPRRADCRCCCAHILREIFKSSRWTYAAQKVPSPDRTASAAGQLGAS